MEAPDDEAQVPRPAVDGETSAATPASTSGEKGRSCEVIATSKGDQEVRQLQIRRTGGAAIGVGALVFCIAGCCVTALVRALRRQQQEFWEACRELRATQKQLAAKEQVLSQIEGRQKQEQEDRIRELSGHVTGAQRGLEAAQHMCKQSATKLEQSMSNLSVTEAELRAARTQLQSASRDLALTRAQLDATEGELGMTRSQNELMKREVDILRRQLREAGHQLEGYIRDSRGRKNAGGDLGGRVAGAEFEDDVAAGLGDWDL